MKYQVLIIPSAEHELDALPNDTFEHIITRILQLAENARPKGAKKLTDRQEYSLRIGSYRVLYEIDDKKKRVCIVAVQHRKDAYK